jgi:imidazoleglycerol-phosphate dehydratase
MSKTTNNETIEINRKTKETNIKLKLRLNDNTPSKINTGVGFLDHMLDSFAKHSNSYLELTCDGDTHIDDHHSVEDCAIVLGQALSKAIYPIEKIERFGEASIVMDEACVSSVIDLSNRPFLVYEVEVDGKIGSFDSELAEEFFQALCFNAKITTHITAQRGKNRHHIIEAVFKSFAVALRRALKINDELGVPSTKGVL